jgi:hypothetical protein
MTSVAESALDGEDMDRTSAKIESTANNETNTDIERQRLIA